MFSSLGRSLDGARWRNGSTAVLMLGLMCQAPTVANASRGTRSLAGTAPAVVTDTNQNRSRFDGSATLPRSHIRARLTVGTDFLGDASPETRRVVSETWSSEGVEIEWLDQEPGAWDNVDVWVVAGRGVLQEISGYSASSRRRKHSEPGDMLSYHQMI